MVEANAILAKSPAQINFFVVDQRREVEQANFKIFDHATRFKDAIQRGFERFRKLLVLDAQGSQFFVRHDHAAHHGNSGRNCGKVRFEPGELLAAIHRFHEERLKVRASALGFGEGEKSRLRLWAIVLVLFVVLVRHCDSVRGRRRCSTHFTAASASLTRAQGLCAQSGSCARPQVWDVILRYPPINTMVREGGTKSGSLMRCPSSFSTTTERM